MVSESDQQRWREKGWHMCRGQFSATEVRFYLEHFMHMHAVRRRGTRSWGEYDPASSDPLKRFPRMGMMHRRDRITEEWLLDSRINETLGALLDADPYAVQSMIYFKPPGARGQALHQDQYYLQVDPGTCVAAWLALDDCDEANGCLQIVPGTHATPVLCPVEADTGASFTDVTVPLPSSMSPEAVLMKAGDVLYFNGQLVHGSFPNTSANRFRRSLIGHYIEGDARQVSRYYHPVLRMNGEQVDLGVSPEGGPCGTWIDSEPPEVVLDGVLAPTFGSTVS